jgi:DNA repair ATPase RecN
LVEALIRLYRQGKPVPTGINKNIQNKITRLRSQLHELDPATSSQRGELIEFNTSKQAQSEYADMQKYFNAIVAMLQKERSDANQVILKYVNDSTNAFN